MNKWQINEQKWICEGLDHDEFFNQNTNVILKNFDIHLNLQLIFSYDTFYL